MTKIDNFKSFVRRNPNLITYVREKNTSWQEFYELYDLYGEDPTIWNKYLNKEERGAKESSNNNPLNNIAKSVGEDTIVAAKDGEGILTPVETESFLKLVPNIETFNSYMSKLIPDINLNNVQVKSQQQVPVQIHYDNLVQVQGDVNNSNIRQMEQIVDNAITKQFNIFNTQLRKAGVR